MELRWMGKAKEQILANSSRENTDSAIRYTSTVSSRPDTLLGCTWESACNFWNNKTRMCEAGTFCLKPFCCEGDNFLFLNIMSYLFTISGPHGRLQPQSVMQHSHVIASWYMLASWMQLYVCLVLQISVYVVVSIHLHIFLLVSGNSFSSLLKLCTYYCNSPALHGGFKCL